jgi:hypothetical protein
MVEPEMGMVENVKIFIFLSCQDRKNLIQGVMSGLWKRLRFCSNWVMFILRQVNNQRDHEVSFANKWHGVRTHLLPRPNKRVLCHFLFLNYWSVKTPASKVLCPLDSG